VVLAIASLGAAVAFVDATIVNIAFPDIERSFPGTSIASLSWVLNAYNIVFAAFLVAAARIADLVGRRRMFILGLQVFTLASLLCALAPSPDALIAFRMVQALGAACLVPAALALVLNAFPPERRSHGVALLSAVGAAAAGLGPSLGGILVTLDNWRLVFLVNIPIGLTAMLLARRRLVESRTPGRRRLPDLPGAVLFGLAIAALVLGVVKGQQWGWDSARVIGSFLAAVGLGGVFIRRCTWHRSPIIDLGLLRNRTFSAANAMTVIGAAGFYGYTLTNVLFLTGVWHYSVLQAGLALSVGPIVAVAVAGPTSRLVMRVGYRPVLVAGGLIWGAGVIWFVLRMGTDRDFLGKWLPGMVLLGIGAGTLFPNLSGVAVASAPGESFATATGLNSVARQVGAALGVAVVVAILGTPSPLQVIGAFHHAWTFAAICLFVSGLGCLLVGRLATSESPSVAEAARGVMRAAPVPSPASLVRAHRAVPAPAKHVPVAQTTAEFLAAVALFADLDPALRAALARQTKPVVLAAGQWLFRQGDHGDAMFVVRAGRLEVVDESTDTVIRQLGRGDAVGELALLTESPRSASVRAARSTDLFALRRDDFESLIDASPALSRALNRALATQLRDTRAPASATRPRPTTVALVRFEDRVPTLDLARRLLAALEPALSVVLLDGSEVSPPGPDEDPAALYGPLLDRAETGHDLVLLVAGSLPSPSPWAEFCLQQADRLLAFTAGGPVSPTLEQRPELRGCDLVAYDADSPGNTLAGWADALDPIESHLLRSSDLDDDIPRIARRLSGRSIGIVLSGGGARAFSHIGVLDELTAAGVTIDRVAGVSMGAVIGALFAMGLDADEIDAICFEEWVQRHPLGDYTLPRHALIRGERFKAMLNRTFGDRLIEKLPRSFMCGYTELRSGSLVLARHGLLAERVGFSICLPVIAPPQVRGREIYIDGSLVDNLPVKAMADLAEGPTIAVDVKASFEPRGHQTADPTGRRERTPSLGETLTRVLLLGSANTSQAATRHADLVIEPRAVGVGLLEFHQIDAAREAGRVAARAAIERANGRLFP
jgi:NTE family protein